MFSTPEVSGGFRVGWGGRGEWSRGWAAASFSAAPVNREVVERPSPYLKCTTVDDRLPQCSCYNHSDKEKTFSFSFCTSIAPDPHRGSNPGPRQYWRFQGRPLSAVPLKSSTDGGPPLIPQLLYEKNVPLIRASIATQSPKRGSASDP